MSSLVTLQAPYPVIASIIVEYINYELPEDSTINLISNRYFFGYMERKDLSGVPKEMIDEKDTIEWGQIAGLPLGEKFFERYLIIMREETKSLLPWECLFMNRSLSEECIERFLNVIKRYCTDAEMVLMWISVFRIPHSEAFVEKHITTLMNHYPPDITSHFWDMISMYQMMSREFLFKYFSNINKILVGCNGSVPESILDDIALMIITWLPSDKQEEFYRNVASNPGVSEKYLEKNVGIFNSDTTGRSWYNLSERSLSVEFFERHIDKVNWVVLSQNRGLPQWFFIKYAHKISWKHVSLNPALIPEFVEKYDGETIKIDWKSVSLAKTITDDFIKRHAQKIDWRVLLKNPVAGPRYKKRLIFLIMSMYNH